MNIIELMPEEPVLDTVTEIRAESPLALGRMVPDPVTCPELAPPSLKEPEKKLKINRIATITMRKPIAMVIAPANPLRLVSMFSIAMLPDIN